MKLIEQREPSVVMMLCVEVIHEALTSTDLSNESLSDLTMLMTRKTMMLEDE